MAILKIGWPKYGPFSNKCFKILAILIVELNMIQLYTIGICSCDSTRKPPNLAKSLVALTSELPLWCYWNFRACHGNLHPLLNGESLKNWPNGEFEKRMSQIWSIFKHLFENGPIFKHLFENGPYLAHLFFKLAIGSVFQTFTI